LDEVIQVVDITGSSCEDATPIDSAALLPDTAHNFSASNERDVQNIRPTSEFM